MVELYVINSTRTSGYSITPDKRLFPGGRGNIYQTYYANTNTPANLLYKDYANDPSENMDRFRHRLIHVVERIDQCDHISQIRDLMTALPTAVVERSDKEGFGVLVPAVYGANGSFAPSLGSKPKAFQTLNVDQRLDLALDLVSQIQILIESGILHCDMTPGNILFTHGKTGESYVQIIDVDTAALLEMTDPTRYYRGVDTVVSPAGRDKEIFCAPEVLAFAGANRGERTNRESELWSLATLIHFILTGLDNPFNHCGLNYWEVMKAELVWPPNRWVVPPEHLPKATEYRERLSFYGEEILFLFRKVYDHKISGGFSPKRRPTAGDWAANLIEALDSLVRHDKCGLTYVALKGEPCPMCTATK